jgi:hypothetical protein
MADGGWRKDGPALAGSKRPRFGGVFCCLGKQEKSFTAALSSEAFQVRRRICDAPSATPHLGRLIWDASSGTPYLGRFSSSALSGTPHLGRSIWDAAASDIPARSAAVPRRPPSATGGRIPNKGPLLRPSALIWDASRAAPYLGRLSGISLITPYSGPTNPMYAPHAWSCGASIACSPVFLVPRGNGGRPCFCCQRAAAPMLLVR